MNRDQYISDFINIDGNWIHPTAIIDECVTLGVGNYIGAYTVIGSNGEIRGVSQQTFQGKINIGNHNIISENVTIQRPFEYGKETVIGDYNIIMAHAHIGHDAKIQDNTEICTSSVIGGYAEVHEGAKVKLHCVVRNRAVIGEGAVVGMGSVVTKNVKPNTVVYGNPAKEQR